MKKFLSLLFGILVVIGIDYAIPKVFPLTSKDNYLLGFGNFRNIARESIGKDRIILVGGSSLGLGVSSEILTQNLEILSLNSGIHAGVGYRNFFRNIEDVLDKERDLIVISPEYSIVSNGGDLGRSDEFCFIAIYVRGAYPVDCVGYSLSSLAKISPILNRNKSASDRDEYIRKGFNRFGDYTHRVNEIDPNWKSDYVDSCSGWHMSDLSNNYIPYIDNLISDGYEVVYIPNFLSEEFCHDPGKAESFHSALFNKFGILGFGESKLLFQANLFYNSPYHLNFEGVKLKSEIFSNQLSSYLNLREKNR